MSKKVPNREKNFNSLSGNKLKEYYSSDKKSDKYNIDPGTFPYTRGIHKNMYRGKLWTMRQFSGFSTQEKTNELDTILLSTETKTYLIPEKKKVDYFIKIVGEPSQEIIYQTVNKINQINQIVTSYTVELDLLKSKQFLIF